MTAHWLPDPLGFRNRKRDLRVAPAIHDESRAVAHLPPVHTVIREVKAVGRHAGSEPGSIHSDDIAGLALAGLKEVTLAVGGIGGGVLLSERAMSSKYPRYPPDPPGWLYPTSMRTICCRRRRRR